jgi:hypothetical protein
MVQTTPTEEEADAKHPQTEATDKTKSTKKQRPKKLNFTFYGCGVPPPSVEPGV